MNPYAHRADSGRDATHAAAPTRLPTVRTADNQALFLARADLAAADRYIAALRDRLAARNAEVRALKCEVHALRAALPCAVGAITDARRPMAEIAAQVCAADWCGLLINDLRGRDRRRRVTQARQRAMRLMHEAGWSLPQIGWYLGGRHHVTVLGGIRADRARAGK